MQGCPGLGTGSLKGVRGPGPPVQTADTKEWAPEGAWGIAALDLGERRQKGAKSVELGGETGLISQPLHEMAESRWEM